MKYEVKLSQTRKSDSGYDFTDNVYLTFSDDDDLKLFINLISNNESQETTVEIKFIREEQTNGMEL